MHRTFDGRKVKHFIGPIRIPWIIWALFKTENSMTIETGAWKEYQELRAKDDASLQWAQDLVKRMKEPEREMRDG